MVVEFDRKGTHLLMEDMVDDEVELGDMSFRCPLSSWRFGISTIAIVTSQISQSTPQSLNFRSYWAYNRPDSHTTL